MIVTSLLVLGGAAVVDHLWRRRTPKPVDAHVAQDVPAGPSGSSAVTSASIDDVNRDLALAGAGLASAGLGALVRPALGAAALPLVALSVVPMVRLGWRDVREKKRLSFVGFEAMAASITLLGGHVAVCAAGVLVFSAGRRLLISTHARTRERIHDALRRSGDEPPGGGVGSSDAAWGDAGVELDRVERMADLTIAPTLAVGGLGWALRGMSVGIAGLWANAFEIAWVTAPLTTLSLLDAAARSGLVIRDGRVLARVREIDVVVATDAAAARHRLMRLDGSTGAVSSGSTAVGFVALDDASTAEDRAALVDDLRASGRRVCYLGETVHDTAAMGRADVAISTADGPVLGVADVAVTTAGLETLPALVEVADRCNRSHGLTYALAGIPSVIAVGGVLALGVGPGMVMGLNAVALGGGVAVALNDRRWTASPGA